MFTLSTQHARELTSKPLDTVKTIDTACRAAVRAAATSGQVITNAPVTIGSAVGATSLRLEPSDDCGAWTLIAEGVDGGLSVHVALAADFTVFQPVTCW